MLNLYKRSRSGVRFWQAWSRGHWGVIHEGKLGVRGKVKDLEPQGGKTMEEVIAEASQKPLAKGYAEIAMDELYQVVVQYRLTTWGSSDDLDKGHEIEYLFNKCLGWTGNGRCDGNDIGSDCLNVFSIVVDPRLAVETMIAELQKNELLEGATVAIRYGNEYEVVHPQQYEGKFSLL